MKKYDNLKNHAHSMNIVRCQYISDNINNLINERKYIGLGIYTLIKARNSCQNDELKEKYTKIIDILDAKSKNLGTCINEYIKDIRKRKLLAKNAQRNYEFYCWVRPGTKIRFYNNKGDIVEGTINQANKSRMSYGEYMNSNTVQVKYIIKEGLFKRKKTIIEHIQVSNIIKHI